MDEQFGTLQTPVGTIGVLTGPKGIRRVGWQLSGTAVADAPGQQLAAALEQLEGYFCGELRVFELPLDLSSISGSTAKVLTTLLATVRYGQTITYGELAARSETGVPARGIGAIMGANPLPLVIPCHRVLSHDGLGGYSGGDRGQGLRTKRWLLELEGALPPTLPLE